MRREVCAECGRAFPMNTGVAFLDVELREKCASMLGICFMEKGMPKLAVKWL